MRAGRAATTLVYTVSAITVGSTVRRRGSSLAVSGIADSVQVALDRAVRTASGRDIPGRTGAPTAAPAGPPGGMSETSDSCGERRGWARECQLGGCSWFVGVRLSAGVLACEGDLEGVQGRLRAT